MASYSETDHGDRNQIHAQTSPQRHPHSGGRTGSREPASVRRLVDGESLEEGSVRARMAAQLPNEEKARRSRRIIRNAGDLAALRAEVESAWDEVAGNGDSG